MKKDELQHSEPLAKFFAPRLVEPAMVSSPEIEKLLDRHDMLANDNHNLFTIRRTTMTLSTIAAVAAISYFAFFSSQNGNVANHKTDRSYKTYQTPSAPTESTPAHTTIPEKPSHASLMPHDTRGPWSAGNDQIYADLTPEELARIGISISSDTIYSYKTNDKDSVECTQFSEYSIPGITIKGHSIGWIGTTPIAPHGINAPKFYPVLMTFSNGNGAAYRIENGNQQEISIFSESDMQKSFREWLEKPGTIGYHAVGFTISSFTGNDQVEHDTVKVMIGKDFSQPPLFPLIPPMNYSPSVKKALMHFAHYYDGTSAAMPTDTLPKLITIRVDTTTPQRMLDEMDSEENSSSMRHLRSLMARLNDLIPVIVRLHGGSGAPDSSDFIFWFEPSEELFNALPPMQAKMFRLMKAPQCMEAPEAVISSAQITYCVSEPQSVDVKVFDLTGHEMLSQVEQAVPGDNTATVNTRLLQSGMYIILVRDKDGSERTRRIWVQNAH